MQTRIIEPVRGMRLSFREATVLIHNTLDQQVNVDILGGIDPELSINLIIKSSSVNSDDTKAVPLSHSDGWLPFVSCELKCTTQPTTGKVTVWVVRSKFEISKIFDGEIRDTEGHRGSVAEW